MDDDSWEVIPSTRASSTLVEIQRITTSAAIPEYAHLGDSGCDLRADECLGIPPGRRGIVHTGLCISMPRGLEAQVRSRSGLAAKRGVFVLNSPGTIDSGFRGEICVVLQNASDEFFQVEHGDRIAQLVFAPVTRPQFVPVTFLDATPRGNGGFGSTGI